MFLKALIRYTTKQVIIFSCCIAVAFAQNDKETWQRIITGDDFVVEIDALSLKFEPNGVISAKFRTILSKPESLPDDPKTKYKTRLETIQFKTNSLSYRLFGVHLLDSKGKIVYTSAADPSKEWTIKGTRTAGTFFSAATALSPYGGWTAKAYRYADGKLNDTSPELDKMVGAEVHFGIDRVSVDRKLCNRPIFEPKTLNNDEFFKLLGTTIESIGIKAAQIDVIGLSCETKEWEPPQSLLIPVSQNKLLILWDGVFWELTPRKHRQFSIPIVIR